MKSHHSRVSSKHGLLPGSPVYIGSKKPNPTQIKAFRYNQAVFESLPDVNAAQIQQTIQDGYHIWLDVCGMAEEQLIVDLCQSLSLHPLMIEDILNTHQRPKLEVIGHYVYTVLKLINSEPKHFNYQTEQISLINCEQMIITVRESNRYKFEHLYQRFSKEHALIHGQGSDFLMYLIIDAIVDDYFHYVEATADQLDDIENKLIFDSNQLNLQTLYTAKRRTTTLRKVISPLRDVVHLLLAEHTEQKQDPFHLYYRDLHDHCVRLLEQVDLHREISSNMLDIYLSIQNNRMNETMKVLTLFASIFIPLSFIASLYGMNFDYMPELKWRYGYPIILGLMTLVVIAMLAYFKRRRIL